MRCGYGAVGGREEHAVRLLEMGRSDAILLVVLALLVAGAIALRFMGYFGLKHEDGPGLRHAVKVYSWGDVKLTPYGLRDVLN